MLNHKTTSADEDSLPQRACDDQLLAAVCRGDLQELETCLKQDEVAAVNRGYILSGKWTTLLHTAAHFGQPDVAKRLLEVGADVDACLPESRETPLFIATRKGHIAVVRCLLDAQANTESLQLSGQSPLYIAAQNNRLDIVAELIRAQADVDLDDWDGTTPLAAAANNGHNRVVAALLAAGARVDLGNCMGITPLHLAVALGHQEVIKVLSKALAQQKLQKNIERRQVKELCTPLYLAAQLDNFDSLCALLEAGIDVNLSASNGLSALSIASSNGHSRTVEGLVKAFVDLDYQAHYRASSLLIAASKGNEETVGILASAQANVNLSTNKGDTPLHLVAQSGNSAIAKILLRAGADPDIENHSGDTATYMAVQNGNTALIQLLLQAQSSPDSQRFHDGIAAIHWASLHNLKDAVQLLIGASANVDIQDFEGNTGVLFASQDGHHDLVKCLVQASANINLSELLFGISPLHYAAQKNYYNVALNLLADSARADTNLRRLDSIAPLHNASQNNNCTAVQLLVQHGADVNQKTISGDTPLMVAAQNGHGQMVDNLLRYMADVDLQNADGNCALALAAMGGHRRVAAQLISAQADVNLISPNSGFSPLMKAADRGHSQVVELLARSGALLNTRGPSGATALYLAADKGHSETVKMLVAAKADLNVPQYQGVTPLYIASQWGHRGVVEELLKAKADPNLKPEFGDNAYLAATRNGYFDIAELILGSNFVFTEATMMTEFRLLIWDCCIGSIEETGRRLATLVRFDADFETFDELEPFQTVVATIKSKLPCPTGSSILSLLNPIVNNKTIGQAASESELSDTLHEALNKAGFVETRAKLQGAAADVLEQIIQRFKPHLGYKDTFVVGSYSEGWGNSLSCLDGRTDVASDIDFTELIPGRLYHLRGHCECPDVQSTEEYKNGHILCQGFASSPATPESGSALRPAVDRVTACHLCCYPPIAPLQQNRVAKSCITQSVLQSLHREIATSPCHVVHAAPPGQAGMQLRVSTTFLEKRLLRSLNTLQGQLFVTLKFLVKKVIGRRVQGLKAYHAKTVTFRMLEETPVEQWVPKNLTNLVRRSLKMLLDSVESSCHQNNKDGRIMEHFFLLDAALYLKGADRSSADEIVRVLRDVIEELPELMMKFMSNLGRLSNSSAFYFTPFHITPVLPNNNSASSLSTLEYHEIYLVIRDCLLELAMADNTRRSQTSITDKINRLPDCARSARECLKALVWLKFGKREAAVKVLTDCRGHEVSRSIEWLAESPATEATVEFVWQHLQSRDSAWRFCFRFDQPLELKFLPQFVAECFPSQMVNFGACFYVNFDAWLTCLRLELLDRTSNEGVDANEWCDRLMSRHDEPDPQELLIAMQYCTGTERLVRLLRRYGRSFTDKEKRMAQRILMLENAELRTECLNITVADIERAIS